MSNQSARQASVRAVTGTAFTYEGDWHALFDMAGIPVGTYNERLLAWINDYMGESFTELNGAMAAFAIDQGYSDWNSMGTFDAAGFSPADIPNNFLWLDASDAASITQVSGSVSQWSDKSGNSRNATQATGANQPVTGARNINGLNTLYFDGSNDVLQLANFTSLATGAWTMFSVTLSDSPTTNAQTVLTGFVGGTQAIGIQTYNGSGLGNVVWGASGQFANKTGRNTGSVAVIDVGSRNGTTITAYAPDGTTGTSANGANATITNGVWIGGNGAGAQSFNGIMGEIIAYNRLLTNAEINRVGNYLKDKWGAIWTDLPETLLPASATVVGFGDSITVGTAATPAPNSWLNKVGNALAAVVTNQGIGSTVLQNSNYVGGSPGPSNGRDRYAAALTGAAKRDLCIIAYGFNDMRYTASPSTMNLANFTNDMQEVITGLFGAGYDNNHIVICSPYFMTPAGFTIGGDFQNSNDSVNQSYGATCRALAVTNNIFFADVYGAMVSAGGATLISGDNVHPNNAGHDVIYRAIMGATKVT